MFQKFETDGSGCSEGLFQLLKSRVSYSAVWVYNHPKGIEFESARMSESTESWDGGPFIPEQREVVEF